MASNVQNYEHDNETILNSVDLFVRDKEEGD